MAREWRFPYLPQAPFPACRPCTKRASLFSAFLLCLSRACLGKCLRGGGCFGLKWRHKKGGFFRTGTAPKCRRQRQTSYLSARLSPSRPAKTVRKPAKTGENKASCLSQTFPLTLLVFVCDGVPSLSWQTIIIERKQAGPSSSIISHLSVDLVSLLHVDRRHPAIKR